MRDARETRDGGNGTGAEGGLWTRRVLAVTAVVLAGAVLLRAGLPGTAPASAQEMTIKQGGLNAMTSESNGRDYLWVVDDRTETLLIYSPDRDGLVLRKREDLRSMFTAARGLSGGGGGVRR